MGTSDVILSSNLSYTFRTHEEMSVHDDWGMYTRAHNRYIPGYIHTLRAEAEAEEVHSVNAVFSELAPTLKAND